MKILSEESKTFEEKIRKDREKKKLKKIFRSCYPELVDSAGNIKYPIDDAIIRKIPLVHDVEKIPEKPKSRKIFMDSSERFEDMLQIWEFANNCLELPKPFKIEDLYAGLRYNKEEEITLITDIVCLILEMTMEEINEEESEDDDSTLLMIKQYSTDKIRFVWPCIVSIVVGSDLFDILPDRDEAEIGKRLGSATPKTFNTIFEFEEKIKIILFLCNSCHDLRAFREYISERLKENNHVANSGSK